MNKPDPILITGAARSGTSMVAGIINICGAWGGKLAGPNRYNPKGMRENREVVDKIIKPYLRELGCDPMGQYPLPDTEDLWIKRGIREQFFRIMELQGWNGKSPLFYKEVKMCLLWPAFRAAFPNAKWVVVGRRDEQIVRSCMRTGFMRAFKNEQGWQWWVDQHKQRFHRMREADLQVKEVWPERMMQGNYLEMLNVIEWLGLQWRDQKIRDFIEPKLYGSKETVNG